MDKWQQVKDNLQNEAAAILKSSGDVVSALIQGKNVIS
jgi:hypothetical protein